MDLGKTTHKISQEEAEKLKAYHRAENARIHEVLNSIWDAYDKRQVKAERAQLEMLYCIGQLLNDILHPTEPRV